MGNLRDRMTVTEGQDHTGSTDFSNRSWGNISTTGLIQNQKGFAYTARCSKCGVSFRVAQQQLSEGVVPTCPRGTACGVTGDTTRRAGVAVEFEPRPTAGPRQRADMAQRAIETKQLEEESDAENS
jgi:hypothetical protein